MPDPFIQPEWIRSFSPENLIPGKSYRWTFKEQGLTITHDEGVFLRMESDKQFNCLWLWFRHMTRDGNRTYDCPIDYPAIASILELN